MKKIIERAKALSVLRDTINKIKEETLEPLQRERDELQSSLIAQMSEEGLKSLKTDTHNFARTIKKDIRIVDEDDAIEYLKGTENYDFYVQPKLETVDFKKFAKARLKADGEILPGTEPTESEYMSITTVK